MTFRDLNWWSIAAVAAFAVAFVLAFVLPLAPVVVLGLAGVGLSMLALRT